MNAIQIRLRENIWLASLAAVLAGILLHYAYLTVRSLLLPLVFGIGKFIPEYFGNSSGVPYLVVAIFNISFVITAGAFASVITLFVVNYLLRPSSMLAPFIAMAMYIILGNWSFFVRSAELVKKEEPEYLFLRLLYPVLVVGIFWLGSLWVIKRNTANPRLVPTPDTARHVS